MVLSETIRINGINGLLVDKMIEKNAVRAGEQRAFYSRYMGKAVPILSREHTVDGESVQGKINNQIPNPYDAEIVDVKTGYMAGIPTKFSIAQSNYAKDGSDEGAIISKENIDLERLARDNKVLNDFLRYANIDDIDSETIKISAICGFAGRLIYIDGEGNPNAVLVQPWNLVIDGDPTEPNYSLYYYSIFEMDGEGKDREVFYAEFYDKTDVAYFKKDDSGKYKPSDSSDGKPSGKHLFDFCPLFGVPNNSERQGDCEKIYELIDTYDKTVSDLSSELEQFRLAYMYVFGADVKPEEINKAMKTGCIVGPDGTQAGFITKTLDGTLVENLLDRLQMEIMRHGKSLNFADESFSGNQSGVAQKFKLIPLESKCKTLERKFSIANRYQFKVLSDFWNRTKGTSIDYLGIGQKWTRNLPKNIDFEATVLSKLIGRVSNHTAFEQMEFIDDPEKEKERIEIEAQNNFDLSVEDEIEEPSGVDTDPVSKAEAGDDN